MQDSIEATCSTCNNNSFACWKIALQQMKYFSPSAVGMSVNALSPPHTVDRSEGHFCVQEVVDGLKYPYENPQKQRFDRWMAAYRYPCTNSQYQNCTMSIIQYNTNV